MNFAEKIAALNLELSTLQGAHATLTGAHKTRNEQFAALDLEKTALTEKVTAHEATIAGHAAKITDLEGKLAAAEKKAGLNQEQISTEVVKQIASAGVVPVKRETVAVNTIEGGGDAGGKGRTKTTWARNFSGNGN